MTNIWSGGSEDGGGSGEDSDDCGVHFNLSGEQGVRWWCGSLLTSSLVASMSASCCQHLVTSISIIEKGQYSRCHHNV